jgi:hypothetical protein
MSPDFRHTISVAVMGLALACTACAREIGRKFDMSAADALTPGVSTLQDAVAVLGPRTAGYVGLSGREVAEWRYLKDWPRGTEFATLMILFGADGRMIAVTRREERKVEGADAKPGASSPF